MHAGEYGLAAYGAGAAFPLVSARQSQLVGYTALRWGCPFVLFWEFYNNWVVVSERVYVEGCMSVSVWDCMKS